MMDDDDDDDYEEEDDDDSDGVPEPPPEIIDEPAPSLWDFSGLKGTESPMLDDDDDDIDQRPRFSTMFAVEKDSVQLGGFSASEIKELQPVVEKILALVTAREANPATIGFK